MNSEVEDCLIRLENQMYGFGGVAGRSASGDRYAVEEHIRDIEGYERAARRDVVHKDARIAELTTEVADLKSKLDFANAMNADQDKDMARYKNALKEITEVAQCVTGSTKAVSIARNALKEG